MVKKKQKIKISQQYGRIFLAIAAVLFVLVILVTSICFYQKHQQSAVVQPSLPSSENKKDDLNNPAVKQAKTIVDTYFEAASKCDLETANSLRLLPKNVTQSKEECQKECPGGLTYKYLKPVSYNSKESGGITIEFASFDYVFGCGDKTYPTLVQMVRSSEDNKWLVFAMG